VIARNSSFIYKGRSVDVRQVAKELGVRYVLEGSVRRSGNRLRITAQLVDGTTGGHLWASKFDGTVEDIFDVQDKITENVVAVVEPHIQQAEINRSRRERPGSLAAYDLYLRGLQRLNVNRPQENAEAVELLNQAIALEPNYALALAYAAYGYEHNVSMGWPPLSADDEQNSLRLAHAALAVAEGDATVLARCGMVLLIIGREYDQGLLTIKRAVDANPNNLTVIFLAGYSHLGSGSLDESLALFHRAIRLSPGDTSEAMCGLSMVKVCLGNYEEALDWAERALAINPSWRHTYWTLIAANAHLGRLEDAKRALSGFLDLEPSMTLAKIRSVTHFKYPSRLDVFFDGMRLAEMPER
jgi:tetratricopeptide (TPR) repeat protein